MTPLTRIAPAWAETHSMRDGSTRKITSPLGGQGRNESFAALHRASLTILSGPASGMEHVLGGARLVVGRGPGVDIALDDDAMSRQHAVLELETDGWHLHDLGSTNGLAVNGAAVDAIALEHGDKIRIGNIELQYVVEERPAVAPSHHLDAS